MNRMMTSHRWRFFRTSGLDQVRLETGSDLAFLEELDQKLWVALACPVKGLELEERTLALIDTDGDGRVRAPELIAAVRFCRDRLVDLDGLTAAGDLLLGSIDAGRPEGQAALATANAILESLGKAGATSLSVSDVGAAAAAFAKQRHNGDGILIPASTDDAALSAVIADAIATVGGEPDRSGVDGVGQARIDAFFAEIDAADAWIADGEARAAEVSPLGDATAAAAAAVQAVAAKVDDYFSRCRLAAYDPSARSVMNPGEDRYAAFADANLSADAAEVAGLPLARIEPERPLLLGSEVNPAWRAAVAALVRDAVTPLLGAREALTEADWAALRGKLAAHVAWAAKKPAGKALDLGTERIRAIRSSDAKARLAELVAEDAARAAAFEAIVDVERLTRYHRDLLTLVNNFTSFQRFYAQKERAIFQAGTLYLDSRACDLCIQVTDPGKHAALAALSKCYLAYCDCTRPNGAKMQIVAVFSGGDSDYLMVGRNGVFYDRKGQDWDATITKIVDNPISIRQAFFAPYKKFLRFVEEQVTKRAATAEAGSTARLSAAAEATATVDKAAAPPPAKFDLGSIALIGVAVSGAAAVIGGLLQAFFGLGAWMPVGFLGLVLAISGPSMLIAGLKLRQRNLGPLLEANGWAINGRVQLNIPFGGSLTHLPELPAGAERGFTDPYQPKKGPWGTIATLAVALALITGTTWLAYHQGWLPTAVEGRVVFFGVPKHLVNAKADAEVAVTDAQAVVASAQEQVTAATARLAELVAAGEPEGPRLERARARVGRSEAKLIRAQDRLDRVEGRLEAATEALDVAIDLDEARVEAAEAAEPPTDHGGH